MKVARDGRFVNETAEIIEAALSSMVARMPLFKQSAGSFEESLRIARLRESCGVPQTITLNVRKPVNYTVPAEE